MDRDTYPLTECKHVDVDRLGFVCLYCGKLFVWDPSWVFVCAGFVLFALHLWYWIAI